MHHDQPNTREVQEDGPHFGQLEASGLQVGKPRNQPNRKEEQSWKTD